MCGISGFLDGSRARGADVLRDIVDTMAGTLSHRGADDSGEWVDPEAGVALGHRRLSIIDLSPQGHQPMVSASGRYVLDFNGEVYNFRALRRRLEGQGHRFRGHSDTEVVLSSVEAWGLDAALSGFNGMFAFALWDRRWRTLHLARDRLGEKPLYYGWVGGCFLFGSELKSLRAHPDWRAEIDKDALALYLRHNYITAPYSIYRGIRKLMPGTVLRIRAGSPGLLPDPVPFWSFEQAAERGGAEPFSGQPEEAGEELHALLLDAVKLRLEADVPLGAFLSGGIDSSTVAALMQAQSHRPVKTFTVGFHEPGYDEAGHARRVAAHLGTDHTELYLTPSQAMAVIPRLPLLYDEPFSDSSQIPTLLVSELARASVKVALSGDGGDELFGGYDRYFLAQTAWARLGRLPRPLRRGAAAIIRRCTPTSWNTLIGGARAFLPDRLTRGNPGERLHKLARALLLERPESMYREMVSHWPAPESLVIGASEPPSPLSDPRGGPPFPDLIHRLMYLDTVTYLPDDILVKLDRASMSVGLETRVPLLDHRVVEFAWRLPLFMKVRDGTGKWLLRQVLQRYVPTEMVDRPKMGFGVPIDAWLRGPLRPWVEDLIHEDRLRGQGLLDPAPIRRAWREHLGGTHNWQYRLWDILMLQAWLESARASQAEAAPRLPEAVSR